MSVGSILPMNGHWIMEHWQRRFDGPLGLPFAHPLGVLFVCVVTLWLEHIAKSRRSHRHCLSPSLVSLYFARFQGRFLPIMLSRRWPCLVSCDLLKANEETEDLAWVFDHWLQVLWVWFAKESLPVLISSLEYAAVGWAYGTGMLLRIDGTRSLQYVAGRSD